FLDENRSPGRKAGELDNRGSHYYLALYWAEALVRQADDAALQAAFEPVAQALRGNEARILKELNSVQGAAQDIGGYYRPDPALCDKAMRPSSTLNSIVAGM